MKREAAKVNGCKKLLNNTTNFIFQEYWRLEEYFSPALFGQGMLKSDEYVYLTWFVQWMLESGKLFIMRFSCSGSVK